MAEAGRSWYTELDFDSYVLDLLLIAWCTICFVIIIGVNAIVSAFGPLQRQPQEKVRGDREGVSLSGTVLPVETAKWFNDAVSWFYLHYYYTPEYAEEWLKSLNEQLGKLGGPVQAKFEKIQSGSLPPKIINVSSEASPTDRLIIHAKLETRDLSFVVFASQQTHEGVKLTNVTASVQRLRGTLRAQSFREGGEVKVSFNFEGKPEIKVQVKPLNPYQDVNELVDLGVVEANVRNSIILAKTTFNVTHMLMPGNLNTINQTYGDKGGGPDRGKGSDRNVSGSSLQPKEPQNIQRRQPSPSGSPRPQSGQQKQQESPEQLQDHDAILSAVTAPTAPTAVTTPTAVLASTAVTTPTAVTAPTAVTTPTVVSAPPAVTAPPTVTTPPAVTAPTADNTSDVTSVLAHEEALQTIPAHPASDHQLQQLEHSQRVPHRDQRVPLRDQQMTQSQLDGMFVPVETQPQPDGMFVPVESQQLQTSLFSAPPKPPRMTGDKRLLVKVIKANGLSVQEIGAANTVCMLSTDEPIQGYSTGVVKNTQNPFWDEHFLFDITRHTQEVRVEVYDKGRTQDEFIGEAIVFVEDLRKTPSSRQILRLRPAAENFEYNSGTVTVEFLFMDPSEAELLLDSMTTTTNYQLSPRHCQELARNNQHGGNLLNQNGYHDLGLDRSSSDLDRSYASESPRFSYPDSSYSSGVGQQMPFIDRSMDDLTDPYPLNQSYSQQQSIALKDSKKGGFGSAILKRFGRKKRALSVDRTTSNLREGDYLRPPEPTYGLQTKDDMELVRPQTQDGPHSPNLKKSRTLGDSLKKLFKRKSRKQSKSRGNSRESSLSRGSRSKEQSRDNSLTRQSQREYEPGASPVS